MSLHPGPATLRRIFAIFLTACALAAGASPVRGQAGGTTLSFGRLRWMAPGVWSARVSQNGEARFLEAQSANPPALTLMTPPGAPMDLRAYLNGLVRLHIAGRSVERKSPAEPALGQTASGLAFAGQAVVSRGEDGKRWYVMYYAFDAGGAPQAVMIATETPQAFQQLARSVGAALEKAELLAAPAPATELPGGGGAQVIREQTGPAADQFVSGVIQAQSAELQPANFRIAWRSRVSMLDVSDYSYRMLHRARDGKIFFTEASIGVFAQMEHAQNIMQVAPNGALTKTAISRVGFAQSVAQLTRARTRPEVIVFGGAESARNGDLYVTGAFYGNRVAVLRYPAAGGPPALIASPDQLNRMSDGWNNGDDNLRLSVAPNNALWLFVSGRNGARIFYAPPNFAVTPNGVNFQEIVATENGQRIDLRRVYRALAGGAPTWEGEWLSYSNNSYWMLSPSGAMRRWLQITLPREGVTTTRPIVLENGDVWLAFNTTYDVQSYVNADNPAEVRNTWFQVGDRSRFVRLRVRNGRGELAEISSERIFAALKASGVPFDVEPRVAVMRVIRLGLDYSNGGLLAYDSHHRLAYSLAPTD